MRIKDNIKTTVIKCPYCNREYLPAEIFIPNSFFGKPSEILRTIDGKIDTFYGMSMNLLESYKCDGCDKIFNIEAKVQFKTTYDSKKDFSTSYSVPLNKNNYTLNET